MLMGVIRHTDIEKESGDVGGDVGLSRISKATISVIAARRRASARWSAE